MLNSQRRVECLEVFSKRVVASLETEHENQLSSIVRHFGHDIKQVELRNIHLLPSTINLLNLMPNLEKIKLRTVKLVKYKNYKLPELNLHKLAEVESEECYEGLLTIFNGLPDGVLRKVKMSNFGKSSKVDKVSGIFENQFNIEEISTQVQFIKLMNTKEMKVKSLQLLTKLPIASYLEGMTELTNLSVDVLSEGDLMFICNNLRSLEKLNIQEANQLKSFEFCELSKLERLEQLALSFYLNEETTNDSIACINASNVVDLNIRCCAKAFDSTISALCLNMPQLKKLKFTADEVSSNVVNIFINGMQELEALELKETVTHLSDYIFPEGLKHKKLIKLTTPNSLAISSNSLQLLQCCESLRELTTMLYSSSDLLTQLLVALPRLEKLQLTPAHDSLGDMLESYVHVLQAHGRNLQHFSYSFFSLTSDVTLEILQEEFGNQFSKIHLTSQTLCMSN